VPAGTVLHLRLQTPVSTKTSKEGQAVTATVARAVTLQQSAAIPAGATVQGKIEKCSEADQADQRAELLIHFEKVDIPGEGRLELKGHISGVPNARETLLADGTIVGVLESETPASLFSGALAKLGAKNADVQKQIDKQRIGQVNTAIEYGQGTDFLFILSEALPVRQLFALTPAHPLSPVLLASFDDVLAAAPKRAVSKENKPGDPINLIFAGSAESIVQAFHAAGWSEPKAKNSKSIFDTARAVINDEGYDLAPVSNLYVYGRKEDLAFEKVLNTFNKRHHLRLWLTAAKTPDGRPIWLGAATHDTGIDVHPGVVSHATDPDLDDEREQVEGDLSSAAQAVQLLLPPHPLSSGSTATGGAWHTDGRLLAIGFAVAGTAAR
jgi:LssY C-terminus